MIRVLKSLRRRADTLEVDVERVVARLSARPSMIGRTAQEARDDYDDMHRPLLGARESVAATLKIPAQDGVPSLTVIYPGFDSDEPVPAMLFIHGGGWMAGSFEMYEPLCRALANSSGAAIVWVEYRLAPEYRFPIGLEDCFRAARWVSAFAGELGLDASRIVIGGDGAGGNLAAVTALAARDGIVNARFVGQALLYPYLDLTMGMPSHLTLRDGYVFTERLYRSYRNAYLTSGQRLDDWRVSPIFARDFSDLPPLAIVHAGFDPLRDEAIHYAMQLRHAGGSVVEMAYPGMIHGFMTMGGAIKTANVAISRLGMCLRSMLEPTAITAQLGVSPEARCPA